jgi:hypothetical protein
MALQLTNPVGGTINSYGSRSGFYLTTLFSSGHQGVDISNGACGAPIYAAAGGTVSFAGKDVNGANVVKITHSADYQTNYAHASSLSVILGQIVKVGDIIGTIGSTGDSTACHLDFRLKQFGNYVNPLPYLNQTLPGGGTSTPITITGEVPTSLLDALGKTASDTFELADIDKVIAWAKAQGLLGNGISIPSMAAETTFRAILAKYVGLPINQALPTAGKEAGNQDIKELVGLGGLPEIDIPGAVMFLGVLLIGITFIGVGGIIVLRKNK